VTSIEQIEAALSPQEAAKLLRVAVQTLAVWRCHEKGPVWHKFGGRVYYYPADIEEFCRKKEKADG